MTRIDKPTLKCDRCGRTTEDLHEMASYIHWYQDDMGGRLTWDLCPACNRGLVYFLDHPDMEE